MNGDKRKHKQMLKVCCVLYLDYSGTVGHNAQGSQARWVCQCKIHTSHHLTALLAQQPPHLNVTIALSVVCMDLLVNFFVAKGGDVRLCWLYAPEGEVQ